LAHDKTKTRNQENAAKIPLLKKQPQLLKREDNGLISAPFVTVNKNASSCTERGCIQKRVAAGADAEQDNPHSPFSQFLAAPGMT
ncbi:MAG: hypothetical protein LBJ46_02140, partial [Planctomycetota bacterium]|nr:hypothetical protein [Planctomycetota bacterium]